MMGRFFLRIGEQLGVLSTDQGRMETLRKSLDVYTVIFVLWGLYRLLFRFPVAIEEFVFKPLIFIPPVLSVLVGEGKKGRDLMSAFGISRARLSASIYFGLTLGVVYLLAVRLGSIIIASHGAEQISIAPLSLAGIFSVSLATAVWEQTVFSGFLLLRLYRVFGDEWASVVLTALLYTMLHLPILWLEAQARGIFLGIQLLLFFLVGLGNAILMLRMRNLVAPILSHTFWSVAVGLLV